jgi:hypothetical protein
MANEQMREQHIARVLMRMMQHDASGLKDSPDPKAAIWSHMQQDKKCPLHRILLSTWAGQKANQMALFLAMKRFARPVREREKHLQQAGEVLEHSPLLWLLDATDPHRVTFFEAAGTRDNSGFVFQVNGEDKNVLFTCRPHTITVATPEDLSDLLYQSASLPQAAKAAQEMVEQAVRSVLDDLWRIGAKGFDQAVAADHSLEQIETVDRVVVYDPSTTGIRMITVYEAGVFRAQKILLREKRQGVVMTLPQDQLTSALIRYVLDQVAETGTEQVKFYPVTPEAIVKATLAGQNARPAGEVVALTPDSLEPFCQTVLITPRAYVPDLPPEAGTVLWVAPEASS